MCLYVAQFILNYIHKLYYRSIDYPFLMHCGVENGVENGIETAPICALFLSHNAPEKDNKLINNKAYIYHSAFAFVVAVKLMANQGAGIFFGRGWVPNIRGGS